MDTLKTFPEKPFIINGVKSWIHCLVCKADRSAEQTPLSHHSHDYIELLYALDTNAYVWLSGEKYKFDTGNLIIVNSKEPHTLTFAGSSSYMCIKFLPQILYADENSLFEFKYVLPFLLENSRQKVFYKDKLEGTDIHNLILEIMDEWQEKKPAFELIIRANILKLFTGIFRHWHNSNIFSDETAVTNIVKTAIQYVENNFDTATEDDVAKYCNVSYNYFSYIFKKTMGKTFSEYITFLRLREAEKQLLSSDKSITEIASRCGFSTSSYFISKFKNSKGITPRQFRESTRHASY